MKVLSLKMNTKSRVQIGCLLNSSANLSCIHLKSAKDLRIRDKLHRRSAAASFLNDSGVSDLNASDEFLFPEFPPR